MASSGTAASLESEVVNRLATPVWIFDIDRSRVVWANEAALEVWRAETVEELAARDLGADMSISVAKRLKQYQEDFVRLGVTFSELWTLYPKGEPITLRVIYSGVSLPDGRMGMVCEGLQNYAETPETLRSAEALLHTTVMISLYDESDAPIYRNPAARGSAESGAGSLLTRFADEGDFHRLRAVLAQQGEARLVAKVRTSHGRRWHEVNART